MEDEFIFETEQKIWHQLILKESRNLLSQILFEFSSSVTLLSFCIHSESLISLIQTSMMKRKNDEAVCFHQVVLEASSSSYLPITTGFVVVLGSN